MDILEIVFVMLVVLFVALVWFFVNRASVRANEQIRLLKEIVEQQRAQTEVLKVLIPSPLPTAESEAPRSPTALEQPGIRDVELDAFNVIPER